MRLGEEELEALRRLREVVPRLSPEEYRAFSYIWDNISVGELLFERDMAHIHGIKKPYEVAARLREKGLVERGEGCYNLARWLRRLRIKVGRFEELLRLLERPVAGLA